MIFHNASNDHVRVGFWTADPAGGEKRLEFPCAPGEEVDIPDAFAGFVPNHAPQLVKGPAPEPASKVSPPPKDPKKEK